MLIRGKETVKPIPLLPMWWLLKLGMPISKARYFRFSSTEHAIKEMQVIIETSSLEMKLNANGYLFESQRNFFKKFLKP